MTEICEATSETACDIECVKIQFRFDSCMIMFKESTFFSQKFWIYP